MLARFRGLSCAWRQLAASRDTVLSWAPFRRFVVWLPLLWLGIFFLVPFFLIVKIAFASNVAAIPPYTALLQWAADNSLTIRIDFRGVSFVFTDSLYILAVLSSLRIAFLAMVMTLLVGFPLAWALANAAPRLQTIGLFLVVLPFWTSFLVRVYAWLTLLKPSGYLNMLLQWLNVISAPLKITDTPIAVVLGITYSYLPFMVLPIFVSLIRMDQRLLEVAYDLGSRRWNAFWTVVVPLSRPGVIAGCLLVFIPAIGEFVIPDLLGGAQTLMLGKVLWQEFFNNRDWPTAASVALLMLCLLAGLYAAGRLLLVVGKNMQLRLQPR